MRSLNGRLQRLEEQAQAARPVALAGYPHWIKYPLLSIENFSIRPVCCAKVAGECTRWVIHGDWLFFFTAWLKEEGLAEIPEWFPTEAECWQWIHEIKRAFYEVKAIWDSMVGGEDEH